MSGEGPIKPFDIMTTSTRLDGFAVVLRTGFANGIFCWDELLAGEARVGWRRSFIDEA